MEHIISHYERLGIPETASRAVVSQRITQESARLEILKRIPAKRTEAERLSAELEAAAAVLLDPEARKRYDESLANTNLPAKESYVSDDAVHIVKDSNEELPPVAPAIEISRTHGQGANAHNQAVQHSPETSPSGATPAPYSTTGAAPARAPRRLDRRPGFPGQSRPDAAASTGVPPPPAVHLPRADGAQTQFKADTEELWRADAAKSKGMDAGLRVVPVPPPNPVVSEINTKSHSGTRAILGLLAAALIIISAYILSSHKQQSSSGGVTLGPTPAKPVLEPQPTPFSSGHVADLRPPQVSLLNPPVLGPSAAAARDARMAQGEITLQPATEGVKLVYPNGRTFILDHQLYSPASSGEAHYASEYGTWVVQTNGQKAGKLGTETKLQLSGLGDINGDGWPELTLEDYSGGAHCCTSLIVLSLRPDGPIVVFGEHLGSASARMQDLHGDGRKEIVTDHLFEYALGSFATGTFELPVAYSSGVDGVYRVNTRAFKNWLQTGYAEERTKLAQTASDPEQHDTELINLFFLAYLTGQTSDAYSYLTELEQIPGREHPLVTLHASLNAVAPEVAQEPAFQQVLAALHSGSPAQQSATGGMAQNLSESTSTPVSASTPVTEQAESKQTLTSAPSSPQVPSVATQPPSANRSEAVLSMSTPGIPAGAYSGPTNGFIVWKGTIEKRGEITFDGPHVSTGTVDGELPGVRVIINLDTKNYALVEYPSESNGWKHFKIRSNRKTEAIIIPWQTAK